MTPIWLDAAGRPRPIRACWTCGGKVASTRFRADHLHPHGWSPPQTLHIADWRGCTTEYLPIPVGSGWWHLVPIRNADQTVKPFQRYEPAAPPLTRHADPALAGPHDGRPWWIRS
jgi:hypothetical protein